jgi:endonuclease YncB( thermonuclease family)
MKFGIAAFLSVIGFAAVAGGAAAQPVQLKPAPDPAPISGQPQIVAVGAFGIDGKRVVLHGIDPVMPRMPCATDRGPWDCGTAGRRILMNMIGREEINCEPRGVDIFGRIFAKCDVHGKDIALALIEEGMAIAIPEETTDYVEAEKVAKTKKAGIWRGNFMKPADYRQMMSGEAIPR